jgi:hypothetical protein
MFDREGSIKVSPRSLQVGHRNASKRAQKFWVAKNVSPSLNGRLVCLLCNAAQNCRIGHLQNVLNINFRAIRYGSYTGKRHRQKGSYTTVIIIYNEPTHKTEILEQLPLQRYKEFVDFEH